MTAFHSPTTIYDGKVSVGAKLVAKLITRARQADQQISAPSDLVGTYQSLSDREVITENVASLLP